MHDVGELESGAIGDLHGAQRAVDSEDGEAVRTCSGEEEGTSGEQIATNNAVALLHAK